MRKALFNVLFVFLSLISFRASGQQDRFWYFGEDGVGIDWGGCEPQIVQGSQIGFEGVATISDDQGVLQFYTNGDFVWDRNHNLMLNGQISNAFYDPTFPLGELSTLTQVALAKNPSNNEYYIFTSDIQGTGSYDFQYASVNMDLNGGLGQVSSITTLVDSPMTEKICTVPKGNGLGFWIITHEYLNNRFLVFEVNENGVNPIPQSFEIGSVHGNTNNSVNTRGELKANLSGTRLCSVQNQNDGAVELFDFDNTTGEISNVLSLPNLDYPFGVSFSPNEELLYIGTWSTEQVIPNRLYQFDISSNSTADIAASQTELHSSPVPQSMGSIKLAPNGKLYLAKDGNSLGVINNPNTPGAACDYQHNGLDLEGGNALFGLNNIWEIPPGQSSIAQLDLPASVSSCEPIVIGPEEEPAYTYLWNTGATTSSIIAENSGTYTLEIDANGCLLQGSIEVLIAPLILELGNNIEVCDGTSVLLNPEINNANPLWSTGSSAPSIEVTEPGIYALEITQGNCSASDEILVNFLPAPALSILGDSLYCPDETALLLAETEGELLWMDGSTASSFETNTSGTITASASLNGCSTTASFEVVYLPHFSAEETNIEADLCEDEKFRIELNLPWDAWELDGMAVVEEVLSLSAGRYELLRSNACETSFISIDLNEIDCSCPIYAPNTFTPNNDGNNDVFAPSNDCNSNLELCIFNRWGELIHQSNGSEVQWNGSVLNGDYFAPDGVYIYQIKTIPFAEEIIEGFVTLIR